MPAPWTFVGYYALTGAYDPQAVCTAFEAEANVDECVVLGTVGEASTNVLNMASTAAINDVGDITAADTAITYDTATDGWDARSAAGTPFYVTIEDEVVEVTADSGTVLTVKRGAQGTVAAAHVDGTAITRAADTISNTGTVIFRVGSDTSVAAITNAATALQGDGVPVAVAPGYPSPA